MRSGEAYRLSRLAQWGSTTRQRRGAGGGHQDVGVYDPERNKAREAAAAQQKK